MLYKILIVFNLVGLVYKNGSYLGGPNAEAQPEMNGRIFVTITEIATK